MASATKVQFAIDENDFNPANLITVDLANNTALPPAQWANVEIDISTVGGYSTIGPKFRNGAYIGAAYISEKVRQHFAAALVDWPPAGDDLYQYQAVLRANGDVRRFHGFKVNVFAPTVGTVAHLEFIPAGGTAGASSNPRRWIDLADASVIDPAANGFTTITANSPVGTIGAVFLTSTAMSSQAMDTPKMPRFLGV
ncbi:MAG TPA: hypothetical protein VFQ65_33360 [Kofleriaceae bacterium]|nr:hypothetical protein [Kofleriaceae bacterium]